LLKATIDGPAWLPCRRGREPRLATCSEAAIHWICEPDFNIDSIEHGLPWSGGFQTPCAIR
jgi:hypothetical protein